MRKLLVKLTLYLFKVAFIIFKVILLIMAIMYISRDNIFLSVFLWIIVIAAFVLYKMNKNGINVIEKLKSISGKPNNNPKTLVTRSASPIIEPKTLVTRTTPPNYQLKNPRFTVFDKFFSENTDPAQKVVYSFEATLEGSNTPKRQKTIASIFQEKDFDTVLEIKEDFTSSLNYVGRVLYYKNAIGNIPTDIYEKISNKWGRYSVHYHIRRITIYSSEAQVYRCKLGFDVLVRI